jgi:hypothetical protein
VALAEVADKIKNSAPEVQEKLISLLTEREITLRVNLLDKAFGELKTLQTDMYKLKADQESFNEAGEVIARTFSKARLDERKKLQEKLEKLENSIGKALEGDFSKLKN